MKIQLSGTARAGKTTLLKKLSEKLNMKVYSADPMELMPQFVDEQRKFKPPDSLVYEVLLMTYSMYQQTTVKSGLFDRGIEDALAYGCIAVPGNATMLRVIARRCRAMVPETKVIMILAKDELYPRENEHLLAAAYWTKADVTIVRSINEAEQCVLEMMKCE